MSARHALLGLLLDRPAYPYELADRLQKRLGPTWAVNEGQVYQTIKALERDRLIERQESASAGSDSRHVYSITDTGCAEFERWFERDSRVRVSRRPLLVKITLAGPQRLEAVLAKIDAYELECLECLKDLARESDEVPDDGRLVRADHLLLRLNLKAEILSIEAELSWARHAREMVSWLQSCDAVWPSARERLDLADEGREARRELFARMAASRRTEAATPGPNGV
jgi:PadR family transcriptional regulator, regulatory protein AphA